MINVFDIGVRIGMTNNVSSILKIIQKDLFGLGRQVDLTTAGFSRMKVVALGAMGAIAGVGILAGLGKLVEAGGELVNQQQLMRTAGLSNQEIAQATAKAWQTTSQVMGSSVVENMKAISDLRIAFSSAAAGGDTSKATAEAIKYLPLLTQARMLLGAQLGGDQGDQVYGYAKSLEMLGATMDPKRFQTLLNEMVQASEASGGRVSGTGFFNAVKYGRTSALGWSNGFIGNVLPLLIQEMGGGSGSSGGPGTALMSAYSEVVGGHMSQKDAEEFWRMHLVDQGGLIFSKNGSIKGVKQGGVAGSDLFSSNPYAWTQEFLIPAMAAAGKTSEHDITSEISNLFGNRTASNIMAIFATQQARFQGNAAENQQATGLGGWSGLIDENLITNWSAFTGALKNMVISLGVPMVPYATALLHGLTVRITEFTLWASTHQTDILTLEKMLAGLGVALTVLGGIAVVSALAGMIGTGGSLALVAVGITGVATAFGLLTIAIPSLLKALPSWMTDPTNGGAGHWVQQGAHPVYVPNSGFIPPPASGHMERRSGHMVYVPDSGPLQVHVVNTGDIGRASSAATVRNLHQGLSAPNSGPSGFNGAASHPGSSASSR